MEGLTQYEKEERPWGNFERFTLNEKTTVKLITVQPGEALSPQSHKHRDEFGRVLKGSGVSRVGDTDTNIQEGDTFFCPRHTVHHLEAGPEGLTYLEIAFGDFDESDITRLEDRYGRVSS